ncbi:hypothetical protein [Aliamphritea spongicola]|uniref:hypothetical protein n=1 Tax=Aliamphritea spongicola TaxID=707589 RepID=UPI00196B53F6|nr:hypothetical protein [Aliamphritea spongicola]MBN3560811.1 hypothetical protein [Aliamphritea spongicola]
MKLTFARAAVGAYLSIALSGCVATKPVVDYTPEQLEVLEIALDGEGMVRAGVYTDNINDLIWTCQREFPVHLDVDVKDMKAKVKLQVSGRYVRSEARMNHLGEITTVANVTSYEEDGTNAYSFKTEVQLRQQRARVTVGRGGSTLAGCPTGWFDLAKAE